MPTKRTTDPLEALSPEVADLLRFGPERVGKTQRNLTPAFHDQLRVLWAQHGPALTASMPRGQEPWFVGRDWFVRQIRWEDGTVLRQHPRAADQRR